MMRKTDTATTVLAGTLGEAFLAVPQATFPSQTSQSKVTLLEFLFMLGRRQQHLFTSQKRLKWGSSQLPVTSPGWQLSTVAAFKAARNWRGAQG